MSTGDYFQSPQWRTPAELEQQRWDELFRQLQIVGRAFDDLLTRLDRIETKLDMLIEQQPRRRQTTRKLADEAKS